MDELTPPRKISWGAVIGGIVIACFCAIIVTPVSMFVGAWLSEAIGRNPASVAIGAGLAALTAAAVMALLWLLVRRQNRDLAVGIIIGGALVVILSGGCGALLSQFAATGVR